MRSRMNFYLLGFLLFCVLPLGLGASLSPETGRMQGRLFDEAGLPMEGPVGLTLSVYESETGGSAVYQESHASVPLAEGSFSVTLGQGVPVTGTHDETLYTGGGERWIEIAVEGETLTPRQKVHAVPYALVAEVAETARTLESGVSVEFGQVMFGSGKLTIDQGGSIELGDSSLDGSQSGVGKPYLDFHYGNETNEDFNVRLQNNEDNVLTLHGGDFNVLGGQLGAQHLRILNGSDVDLNNESYPWPTLKGGIMITSSADLLVEDSEATGQALGIDTNEILALQITDGVPTGGHLYLQADGGKVQVGSSPTADLIVTGDLLVSGDLTLSGNMPAFRGGHAELDRNTSYDVWVQGCIYTAAGDCTSTDDPATADVDEGSVRNLALLGSKASDKLYVNHNSEYRGGTVIGGPVVAGGDLSVTGQAYKPGGGSWSVASDGRLKEQVRPLDGSLETLLALQGVTFRYKDPDAIGELQGERVGFVAQDVEEVFPDWISEGHDGYKRMTVRGFEALAVEALRELRTEAVGALRELRTEKDAEIALLRKELALLHKRMSQFESQTSSGVPR